MEFLGLTKNNELDLVRFTRALVGLDHGTRSLLL